MKKEVIEEMNNFAIRILKGKENVHPQEIAILPEILHILKTCQKRNLTGKKIKTILIRRKEKIIWQQYRKKKEM